MKKIIPFLLFLFVCQNGIAQSKIETTVSFDKKSANKNEIVYQKNRPLKLSDFEGSYENGSNAVAMAYSGVSVAYDGVSKNGRVHLNIKLLVSFNKSKSWCLERAKNEYTLTHEQRHFDITVLSACELYHALKSYNFTQNFQQEIADLQKRFQEKNEDLQDVYDAETKHGINKAKQAEWNIKIREELQKQLEYYEQ